MGTGIRVVHLRLQLGIEDVFDVPTELLPFVVDAFVYVAAHWLVLVYLFPVEVVDWSPGEMFVQKSIESGLEG